MGGAGPEREGIYAVSASDVRKDQKAKEKAPLFLHAFPGKEDMAKAQVTLRTLLSVQDPVTF